MSWLKTLSRTSMALALCTTATLAMAKPVVVEDVLGRKVKIDAPAKRILLGFYIEDFFAVGGDKSFDRVAGMSRGWFVKSRPACWPCTWPASRNWHAYPM
ncbi:hypothetical protein ACFSQE_15670 [Vogesella fluminis]|uniref:Uncharacterized protein n=1 Tax=Vogesella fluminis TaxID=1069161 RepID=A0ABQ3H7L7_9NEIS|nr:hypothetical protein [Vogesella fluminis]GHD72775.1 hypothetical protein GCM10011419_06530 [Vogesella fluminis]